jgi:hypothetical protein
MPALLAFAGMPLQSKQQCFAHKGSTGSSLSIYRHRSTGRWMFCCNAKGECGIEGDVVELWYRLVLQSGLAPVSWTRSRAANDLLRRVRRGEIDASIVELVGIHTRPPAPRNDAYWEQLKELVKSDRPHVGEARLPKAIGVDASQAVIGLFPANRFLMMTPKHNFHPIMLRDDWLAGKGEFNVSSISFVSSNYCSRSDADGTSFEAFEGIPRRWIVVEDDTLTLEQQYWIHRRVAKRFENLGCVCWSGGKSIHGWYFVEGWPEENCFELYAKAVSLGIRDINQWRICQQVRLPGGYNWRTKRQQDTLIWF